MRGASLFLLAVAKACTPGDHTGSYPNYQYCCRDGVFRSACCGEGFLSTPPPPLPPAPPPCILRAATLPSEAACNALNGATAGCDFAGPWLVYRQTTRGRPDIYYCSSSPMTTYGLVTPTGDTYRTLALV